MKYYLRLISIFFAFTSSVFASSGGKLADVDIPEDAQSMRKGAEVATNWCMLCHSFKYIKYSNLTEIGYSEEEVDAIRGSNPKSSPLVSRIPGDVAKKSFGSVPPDLSVMAKARKGGPNYIYTLMTSYHEDENGVINNSLFPGIKMPDILAYSIQETDEARQEKAEMAKNVSAFLNWTADPHAQERKTLGKYVLVYLFILTFLFWLVKRRVWARLH